MSEEKQVKVTAATAAVLCRGLPLSARAHELLTVDLEAHAYVALLLQEQLFLDAIRFLSRALPARAAIFWACLCARQAQACAHMPLAQKAALRSAAAWVLEPSEPRRLSAREAGEKAKLSTPAGCAALAAFWSVHEDGDKSKHLSARAAGAAVMIAAASGPLAQLGPRYRQFLDLGLKIAAGACSWEIADKNDGRHHDA